MELLGDMARLEPRFGPFGDSFSVGAIKVHGLRQMYHRLRNRFGLTWWYLWVIRLNWKLILVRLQIVLIMTHDRCIVCSKSTIGLKIVLDTPGGNPW
jgi:hypothetical protein